MKRVHIFESDDESNDESIDSESIGNESVANTEINENDNSIESRDSLEPQTIDLSDDLSDEPLSSKQLSLEQLTKAEWNSYIIQVLYAATPLSMEPIVTIMRMVPPQRKGIVSIPDASSSVFHIHIFHDYAIVATLRAQIYILHIPSAKFLPFSNNQNTSQRLGPVLDLETRIQAIAFHPTEPWFIMNLHNDPRRINQRNQRNQNNILVYRYNHLLSSSSQIHSSQLCELTALWPFFNIEHKGISIGSNHVAILNQLGRIQIHTLAPRNFEFSNIESVSSYFLDTTVVHDSVMGSLFRSARFMKLDAIEPIIWCQDSTNKFCKHALNDGVVDLTQQTEQTDNSDHTNNEIVLFSGHTRLILQICENVDRRLVVSASHDKTVRIWNSVNGTCLFIFRKHTKQIQNLFLHNQYAITSCFDKSIRVIDISNAEEVESVNTRQRWWLGGKKPQFVCCTSCGYLIIGYDTKCIEICNLF